MFEEHHALRAGTGGIEFGRELGEGEAGHAVGRNDQPLAVELGAKRGALRLVGQREHCVRVCMVDEGRRDPGVQQRLDRGIGRLGVEQRAALRIDHRLVRQRRQPAQRQQRLEPHRRQARRLDGREIPARTLDAEYVHAHACNLAQACLQRGIAAAVLDERRLLSDESARVDSECQVRADALQRVACDDLGGFGIRPPALHRAVSACSG